MAAPEPVPPPRTRVLAGRARESTTALIALFAVAKLVLHAALSGRYDYNGDELYFIACGEHAAFGYVDHPPLVPWLARLSGVLFDHGLFGLRLPSALAGAGTMALVLSMTRQLGGGRFAIGLAGVAMLAPPAYLRMGSILCLPVLEVFFWTLATYCLLRLVNDRRSRWWLGIGLAAGLGFLTKHSMLFWGTGAAAGLVATPLRRELRTPYPWIALSIAAALAAPNLIWQVRHGWPTLEFLELIGRDQLQGIPRVLFLLGQVLYMHPLTLPLWLVGLGALVFGAAPHRAFGLAFLAVLALLVAGHAKPYYLAPAYPPLFAAGAVQVARWTEHGSARGMPAVRRGMPAVRRGMPAVRRGLLLVMALGALVTAPFSLPLLPLATADRWVGRLVGFAGVAPEDLTFEFHHEFGWREQAEAVGRATIALSPAERERCAVLAHNYAQASAVSFFGAQQGLTRAVSGHMTYFLWGWGEADGDPAIALGIPEATLREIYAEVEPAGEVAHPLAVRTERHHTIHVCRKPRVSLAEAWPRLRRFYFRDRE